MNIEDNKSCIICERPTGGAVLCAKHTGSTDDPSEVRPGDVRRFEGVVGRQSAWSTHMAVSFPGSPDLEPMWVPTRTLAASTLIRRARPEITVGMRVQYVPVEGPWFGIPGIIGRVRGIDGDEAWLEWEAPWSDEPPSIRPLSDIFPVEAKPLSDLTPVEGQVDG